MSPGHAKHVLLHAKIRRSLQSGRYLPGEWLDYAALAAEFHTSDMPVRLALHRLIGEGLLEPHARGGVHLPLPTEVELRDRYTWLQHMLQAACEIAANRAAPVQVRHIDVTSPDRDLPKLTWQLFDAIAHASALAPLHQEVKRNNDWLAPIRRAKHHLVDDVFDELAQLNRHWQARDWGCLKAVLHDYHERRKKLVPSIVVTLKDLARRVH